MRKMWLIVVSIGLAAAMAPATAAEHSCREVTNDWTWFSDHVALTVEYVIVGQPGRRYEVGTGLKIGGRPRGWRSQHSGNVKITAWGAGALHIRRDDDGPPFKVCVGPGKLSPITIMRVEF